MRNSRPAETVVSNLSYFSLVQRLFEIGVDHLYLFDDSRSMPPAAFDDIAGGASDVQMVTVRCTKVNCSTMPTGR
jgi:hypothetical protein